MKQIEFIIYIPTQLEGFQTSPPPFTWIRIRPEHIVHFNEDSDTHDLSPYYEEIAQPEYVDSEREMSVMDYVLSREDVGYYMGARFELASSSSGYRTAEEQQEEGSSEAQLMQYKFVSLLKHGPVRPGPPRLTDFSIVGSMKVRRSLNIWRGCAYCDFYSAVLRSGDTHLILNHAVPSYTF
jgi:hypothetical protein